MSYRKLPMHRLDLTKGLWTNFSEESVAGAGLVRAQNWDGFDTFLGAGKVPGSTRPVSGLTGDVFSINQFEFFDLDQIRKRHQLVSAVSSGLTSKVWLYDGTSTTDLGSRTDLSQSRLQAATMNDRLHLSGRGELGLATGGIKWDGSRLTPWGVQAPGTVETSVEAFDDHTDWTAGANATNKADDAVVKRDLTGSVSFDKSAGGTACYIERTGLSHDLSTAGEDLIFFWVFLPSGVLQKLNATDAVSLFLESSASNDATFNFSSGSLLPGWNLISAVLSSPDASTGTINLAAVSKIRVSINAPSGNTFAGVRVDRMYVVDEGRATAAAAAPSGSGRVETNSYRVTFLTEYGLESNAGPISGSVSTVASAATATLTFSGNPSDGDTVTVDDVVYTFKTVLGSAFDVLIGGTAAASRDNLRRAINDTTSDQLNWSGNQTVGDTVTINGIVYTFRNTLADPYDVKIGAGATDSRDNLRSAINGTGTPGTDYHTDTPPHALVTAVDSGTDLDVTHDTPGGTLTVSEVSTTLSWAGTALFHADTTGHGTVTASDSGSNLLVTYDTLGTAGNSVVVSEIATNLAWNASTLSGAVDGQDVDLTAIPVAADDQVIARRIYRDLAGDNVFRFVHQINDNTTTTYTDAIATASLGVEPPIAGDDLIDHSPPGRMRDVVAHEGRIYGISGDDGLTLLISDVFQGEAFKLTDRLQVEDEIISIKPHAAGLLLFGTDKVFILHGDGVTRPFRVDLVNTQLGSNGTNTCIQVKGIVCTQREYEVFMVANVTDAWMINGPVLDLFRTIDKNALEDMHIVHDRARFRVVFFGQTTAGGAYDVTLVYQYGTSGFQEVSGFGDGTDPQDLRKGTWWTMNMPASHKLLCSEVVEVEGDEVPQLWTGATGEVHRLNDPTATSGWYGGAAIDAVLETAAVPIGAEPGGRGQARMIELNVKHDGIAGAMIANVSVYSGPGERTALAGAAVVVTLPAGTGDSTIRLPVPSQKRGEWARVTLQHNSADLSGVLRVTGLGLYFIPRRHRGIQTS